MKNMLILSTYFIVFLTSCATHTDEKTNDEKFLVTHALLRDTTYIQEYVADIQAIQNVEIRARVKGYLDQVHVDEGEYVKEGQVLFSISNREYQEAWAMAKATLKSVIAEAKSAELEVKNTQLLLDKKVISTTELEMAKAKLEAIEAKVEEAKANESNASLNLSFTTIKAPFNGIINRIPNKKGSLIDEGSILTTISNNHDIYAYFHVPEKEYLEIIKEKRKQEKQEVSLLLANNDDYPYKGTIETVDGEIDASTGNISFRARFKNPEQILKHGASGKIQVAKKLSNVLLVPQKSTFEIQENIYVFVVDQNNKVSMRRIIPLERLPQLYAIQSGLKEDEKFIYEGIQRIKEGDIITPEVVPFSL